MKFILPYDHVSGPFDFKKKCPNRRVFAGDSCMYEFGYNSISCQPPDRNIVIFNTKLGQDSTGLLCLIKTLEDQRVELKEDSVLFYVYPERFVSFCMLQKKTLSSDLIRQLTTYL